MATGTLSRLTTLKAVQLREIAAKTGINVGGTKPALIARLRDELAQPRISPFARTQLEEVRSGATTTTRAAVTATAVPPGWSRLISVDMGIRNLAFCVLDVPPLTLHGDADALLGRDNPPGALPRLLDWRRIAVSKKPVDEDNTNSPANNETAVKEAFDPPTYAQLAHGLVTDTLLPHRPDVILIERQRYRSMGSSAVQEWTVRVNMFEAMLYAVLRTFASEPGARQYKGRVFPVLPGRVTSYWVGDVDESLGRRGKSAKARSKGNKIDLVGGWLQAKTGVDVQDSARGMVEAFLERWQGKRRKKGKDVGQPAAGILGDQSVDEVGKLDDLADCLLQAVAWVRWEETRRRIVHGEALEHETLGSPALGHD